jgi:hypothetical protein
MVLMDVAADLGTLGTMLKGDLVAWGSAAIGLALVAASIIWVRKMLGY